MAYDVNEDLKTILEGLSAWAKASPTEEQLEVLKFMEEGLDDLDEYDFFGTEGWRNYFNME